MYFRKNVCKNNKRHLKLLTLVDMMRYCSWWFYYKLHHPGYRPQNPGLTIVQDYSYHPCHNCYHLLLSWATVFSVLYSNFCFNLFQRFRLTFVQYPAVFNRRDSLPTFPTLFLLTYCIHNHELMSSFCIYIIYLIGYGGGGG